MTPFRFIQTFFITQSLVFASCNAQVNPNHPQLKANESSANANGHQKIIKNHSNTKYPDEYFFVQCGLQDRSGNMWFGSTGDGIYYYDGSSFINFTRKDGLCHNDILCCMEDKNGNIWFGTRNGLIRYTPTGKGPEKRNFKSFIISADTIDHSTQEQIPYTSLIGYNFVWSIMQGKNGKIWFATDKGVYTYNPTADKNDDMPNFTNFLDNDSLINSSNLHLKDISNIHEDRNGNIWFVSSYLNGEGICFYDGKHLTNYKPDSIQSFRSILERENGRLLFLSTFHGVYSFDGNAFTNFTDKIGLKGDRFTTMLEDKAGNLWFGQSSERLGDVGDGGVWRYDGKSLKNLTTKDGLSNNGVFCIAEDMDGNLWFGTSNTGLCRYDGKSFTDFTE